MYVLKVNVTCRARLLIFIHNKKKHNIKQSIAYANKVVRHKSLTIVYFRNLHFLF